MRETYWGYWLFILGLFVIGVMLLVNNISTTSTQDYYNIKEVTQASMIDAVDFSYYRLYGTIKMSEQKFVENFARRFAENINMANVYDIDFYDLYEVPPKVSVKISTSSRAFQIGNSNSAYDVVSTLSAILEIGGQGESTPQGNPNRTKKSSCNLHINSNLMDYFKGKNVGDHNINRESIVNLNSLSETQRQKLKEVKNVEEFKSWFFNEFYIDGQKAKDYFTNNRAETIKNNSIVSTFISRGWIQIS